MNDNLRIQRDKKAYVAGEGSYLRLSDEKWVSVDVTFYRGIRLWISDENGRREISKAELAQNYRKLAL